MFRALFQERSGLGPATEASPLDTMRSLEHYLTDIVRGSGDAGKWSCPPPP